MGKDHVRCICVSLDGSQLSGIAFRCADSPLGELLLQQRGAPIHVAGTLRLNRWQGRESVQLTIDDAAVVEQELARSA